MKEKKTYIAPLMSVNEIKTEDVIMASGKLTDTTFSGAYIKAGKVYEIDLTE